MFILAVLVSTSCERLAHDASGYRVRGIDISHYQGEVDWKELAYAGGHDFVFIKATEGRSLRDKNFDHNWSSAKRAGLRRGAYHFFRPEVAPETQASLFIATVDLQPGDFPPVLDVEKSGHLNSEQLVTAINAWSEVVELRYGVRPIIYTGQNFYNRYLAGKIDDYPLWLARYDRSRPVTACGRPYQFWQYSDEGESKGVVGAIDQNVFTGSYAELVALTIPTEPLIEYPEVVDEEVPVVEHYQPELPTHMDDLASFGVK